MEYSLCILQVMRTSALEEYGLRCLLRVAAHDPDQPLGIPDIAADEGLSQAYAAKIMRHLRQGGLVESVRGAGGGYKLARESGDISVWDVLVALDGPLFPGEYCRAHAGKRDYCANVSTCSVRAIWNWADRVLSEGLSRVSLADLVDGETHVADLLAGIGLQDPARPTYRPMSHPFAPTAGGEPVTEEDLDTPHLVTRARRKFAG